MKNKFQSFLPALVIGCASLALGLDSKAGDIYGTITLKGTPPPELDITPLKNDPNCGPLHKEMPTTHFYVVGPNGEFGDVVVSVKDIEGKFNGNTAKPLVIEQKGCEYWPYVAACQTGQNVIVKNMDPVLHNVHVTPENPGNKEVNQAQMPHGPDLTFTFNAPEEFLRFKCDVHPWMFAYVSVFSHPFFAVSDKQGSYRIHGVPPGHFTLVAAHRKLGVQQKAVDVGNQDLRVDFTFSAKPVS